MSRVAGHLVLSDPDNAHSLIVRGVDPQDGESPMPMALAVTIDGKQCTLSIEQWLQAYSRAQGDEAIVTLGAVIKEII